VETVGITAAWASYGSYESVDPSAEARASTGRQQYYWNKDTEPQEQSFFGWKEITGIGEIGANRV
jgi:hypothetical protein